jgi:hypothetical protein
MALFQASGGCMKKYRAMVFASAMFALAVSTRSFDTQWHADATRIAMERNGLSSDARLLCQFTNYLTDYFSTADLDKEVYERLLAISYQCALGSGPRGRFKSARPDQHSRKTLGNSIVGGRPWLAWSVGFGLRSLC